MFEETVRLSVTVPVWILSFRITDYSFWKNDQHKNFDQKMSSELEETGSGSDIAVNVILHNVILCVMLSAKPKKIFYVFSF